MMPSKRSVIGVAVLCVAAVPVGCHHPGTTHGSARHGHSSGHGGGQHGHGRDLDSYIAAMESPERAIWQKPDEVLAALELSPGERVADIGAGPGYFTLPIAKAVGPGGKVWAVDIEQKMLDHLRQRADAGDVHNIDYLLVPEDDPSLPKGSVDTIIIVDTYHHFADRPAYVAKLRAALAPGGRLVNIDFIPKPREERGFGPPLRMQLSRETVDAEMAAAGLYPKAAHTFLPEQYFVEYILEGD